MSKINLNRVSGGKSSDYYDVNGKKTVTTNEYTTTQGAGTTDIKFGDGTSGYAGNAVIVTSAYDRDGNMHNSMTLTSTSTGSSTEKKSL